MVLGDEIIRSSRERFGFFGLLVSNFSALMIDILHGARRRFISS